MPDEEEDNDVDGLLEELVLLAAAFVPLVFAVATDPPETPPPLPPPPAPAAPAPVLAWLLCW